jgi:hypothetical protein
MAAIMNGDTAMLDLLIECRSDIEDRTTNGITPLLFAASEGRTAMVSRLLLAGANVNKADDDGWTPLLAAAARGHLEIVQALIENGARIDASLKGVSAIDLARAGNHAEMEDLLRHAAIEQAIRTDIDDRGFQQLRTSLYALEHPAAWQAFHDIGSPELCLGAPAAILRSESEGVTVGYGSILSYYPIRQEGPGALTGATGDLLRELLTQNPDMHVESAPCPASPNGHQALVTTVMGNSPFGSVRELVVTVGRPEGLFCMFLVAPPRAWPAVQTVFDRMMGSLEFSVNTNGFCA